MAYNDSQNSSLQARLLLSGTTAMALMFMAPLAAAQAPGEDISDELTQTVGDDEIVVTGIRNALKEARDLKRDADTAIDSITASDVSALPDLSVAEALARIPGVVVQRVSLNERLGGDFPSPEGSGNLVRGLQLVRSELNGREAFSANQGRSLDFGTIPPELIGAVDVYKNATADLVQGGIGGTINLRTLEPFDRNGQFAVATADAVYTDLRDDVTPELSLVMGNQFDMANGGRLGILGSVSYSELNSDLNGFQIGQLSPQEIDGVNVAIPGGVQLRTNEVDRRRDSFYLAGQYENAEQTFQATAKYVRASNRQEGDERTVEWFQDSESVGQYDLSAGITTRPFNSSGLPRCNGAGPDPALCEETVPVTAIYESGLISNNNRDWTGSDGANFSTLGINQIDNSEVDDISLNMKFQPAENIFVNLDGHYTSATATRERIWAGTNFFANFEVNPDLDNPAVRIVGTEGWSFNNSDWVRGNSELDRGGATNDPRSSFFLFAADQFQDNEGDLYSLSGDVEYEFSEDGWFDSVKVGGRFTEREQINRNTALNWSDVAAPWAGGYSPLDVNQAGFERVEYDDFFRGDVVQGDQTEFLFVNRSLIGNYQALQAAVGTNDTLGGGWSPFASSFEEVFDPQNVLDSLTDDQNFNDVLTGETTESTIDAFARLDFGQEFSNGMSLDANIGLRYTVADVTSVGANAFRDAQQVDPTVRRDGQTDEQFARAQREDLRNFIPDAIAFSQQSAFFSESDVDGDDYFLPSANAKFNLNENMLLRAGVSKNITRPRLSQLSPTRATSLTVAQVRPDVDPANPDVIPELTTASVAAVNVFDPSESGGNPSLSPIEAWNYDASFEYYWGGENSLTASVFKKDISDNIIFARQQIDTVTLDGAEVPVFFTGLVNQDKVDLQGFELAYQQFYDFLPGPLSNLGLQANYTYIDAEATPPTATVDADGDGVSDNFENDFRYGVSNLLGLSKHTANAVGIYQNDDWEFRVAYNWRSRYLGDYREFITGNPIFQDARGYLDGSVKWDINDALQFRVQGANLLNTEAKASQQIDADGQRFGRTNFIQDRRIKVGFRYAFN